MRIKDFMVHKEFKFWPSARLNIVIGPSGAGKSAVLAALCVCLGGKVADLGRVSNFNELVRKGSSKSEVEVCCFFVLAASCVRVPTTECVLPLPFCT